MSFGFATVVDLLSWTAVLLLGAKAVATILLLRRDRDLWFASRSGALMWWCTKITPLLAIPCLIAIALIERRPGDLIAWSALGIFVAVAVPLIVWNRFFRRRQILGGP